MSAANLDTLSRISAWLVIALLPLAVAIPFAHRRARANPDEDDARLRRLTPHYAAGLAIGALALVHAGIAGAGGAALRADLLGIYIAFAAICLVLAQLFIGALLREPRVRRRDTWRSRHRVLMAAIVVLAALHIVLNSTTLRHLLK